MVKIMAGASLRMHFDASNGLPLFFSTKKVPKQGADGGEKAVLHIKDKLELLTKFSSEKSSRFLHHNYDVSIGQYPFFKTLWVSNL